MNRDRVIVIAQCLLFCSFALVDLYHQQSHERTTVNLNSRINKLEREVDGLQKTIATMVPTKTTYKITAYSNDSDAVPPSWYGKTATGKTAKVGLCAADWKVLKPGTMLYVPGYGICQIEDRGSGVKGRHIDVFMDTLTEAREWGVVHQKVYLVKT